jgi:hypothetical protein
VACLVRFLSSRQRTHPMTDLAMPSANAIKKDDGAGMSGKNK